MTSSQKKIYRLMDPRSGETVWVGATSQPIHERVRHHMCGDTASTKAWCEDLKGLGIGPVVEILEDSPEDWQSAERIWISKGREMGWPLFNRAPGGQVFWSPHPGWRSEEGKRSFYEKMAGNNWNRYKRKPYVPAPNMSHPHTPETKQLIREKKKGRKLGPFLTKRRLLALAVIIDGE